MRNEALRLGGGCEVPCTSWERLHQQRSSMARALDNNTAEALSLSATSGYGWCSRIPIWIARTVTSSALGISTRALKMTPTQYQRPAHAVFTERTTLFPPSADSAGECTPMHTVKTA